MNKRFGGLVAVNDVDFDVNSGEILGMIGPNGAGKTTIFNLITGVYRPDSGSVRFKGKKIIGLRPHKICDIGIARTFQIPRSFLDLTVLHNVMVGAFCRVESAEEAMSEAMRVIKYVGLSGKEDVFASSLTIADRKALELARALATKPDLLLLDEVVAGLNPKETLAVIERIKKIREGGVTLLVIEHVMKAIMTLSDRIIVIHHGEKIAEGTPKRVASDKKVIDAYMGEAYMEV